MTDRNELPIPDFDHLSGPTLAHRIRSLDADALERLLRYERAHANRLPVVTLLQQRAEALRSGEASPSGGDPRGARPETAPPPAGGSPVEATQQSDNQPLRHGVAEQTPNRNLQGR